MKKSPYFRGQVRSYYGKIRKRFLYDMQCARISLKNIEQAISIYKKFVDFMIRGHYSFEQRANILKKMEIIMEE